MILKLERPMVFFDLETTGLDIQNDRIIEVGLVRLDPDGKRETMCERVDPGIDIPESSTKVHGIHNDEVRGLFGKPRLPKVAVKLVEFIGDADIAGFNSIAYDLPLWNAEMERYDIPFESRNRYLIDAKLIFNAMEPGWDRFLMGPRNLSAAVRHYCGKELVGAHAADADAEATIDVLLAQLERHSDLPRDAKGLHEYCKQVHQQQAEAAR